MVKRLGFVAIVFMMIFGFGQDAFSSSFVAYYPKEKEQLQTSQTTYAEQKKEQEHQERKAATNLVTSSCDYSDCQQYKYDLSKYPQCLLLKTMDCAVPTILYSQVDGDKDDDPSDDDYNCSDYERYPALKGRFLVDNGRDRCNVAYADNNNVNINHSATAYSLTFLYAYEKDEFKSSYHKSNLSDAVKEEYVDTIIRGLDYVCRAQAQNGAVSENEWTGVRYLEGTYERPERSDAGTSVSGFAYYGIAQAINLMYEDSYFQEKLGNLMDANGNPNDGTNGREKNRREGYMEMLRRAANFLQDTSDGGGRGHAPNQEIANLVALHAIQQAYAKLERNGAPDYSILRDCDNQNDSMMPGDSILCGLRKEILNCEPKCPEWADRKNGLNKWFSEKRMILEGSHAGINPNDSQAQSNTLAVGYSSGYSWVTLRYMTLLKERDSSFQNSSFFTEFMSGLKYLLHTDLSYKKGGYQVAGISRRTYDGDLNLVVSGLGQDYSETLRKVFVATLERFVNNPSAFLDMERNDYFGASLYRFGDLLACWKVPTDSTYKLSWEENLPSTVGQVLHEDSEANLKVENTNGTLEGLKYTSKNWWGGTKTYYWGSSEATLKIPKKDIDGDGVVESWEVDIYGLSCDLSQSIPEGGMECKDGTGAKEIVIYKEYNSSEVILKVKTDAYEVVSESVDNDNDGVGNYYDTDDDNDQMPDTWEAQYGFDPLNASDASQDYDGDGYTNLQEYQAGTDPKNSSSFPSGCSIPPSGDWTVAQSCTIATSMSAPANVVVNPGVVLTISSTGSLNIDFINHSLTVRDSGGVLIREGGKIY